MFRRHRTEQRRPLSIMNNPLVVLSTRPMHILKKYPVNMLCIGLVRRLDKKNQHPRNWLGLCFHASAHGSLPKCCVSRGADDLFGHHIENSVQRLSGHFPSQFTFSMACQDTLQIMRVHIRLWRFLHRWHLSTIFFRRQSSFSWRSFLNNLKNFFLIYNI